MVDSRTIRTKCPMIMPVTDYQYQTLPVQENQYECELVTERERSNFRQHRQDEFLGSHLTNIGIKRLNNTSYGVNVSPSSVLCVLSINMLTFELNLNQCVYTCVLCMPGLARGEDIPQDGHEHHTSSIRRRRQPDEGEPS